VITIPELWTCVGLVDDDDIGDWGNAGVKRNISGGRMGHMLGNTLTLSCIDRVWVSALWAAGLSRIKPTDRWANMSDCTCCALFITESGFDVDQHCTADAGLAMGLAGSGLASGLESVGR